MVKNSKLKDRRLELKLTLDDVAQIVGVGKSTVRKWETGLIENMKIDKVALLAKALKVEPNFIMGIDFPEDEDEEKEKKLKKHESNVGEIVKTVRVRMYGKASAGNGYINLTDEIGYFDVPAEYVTNSDVYTIKISGESMTGLSKSIPDGSVAVVDPQLCATPEALDGKVCIFTYNDETYIKQLVIDKQGIIRLKSFNPNYDDIIVLNPEDLRCEGRVIVTFVQSNW